jgi:putative oxidoreductase
MAFSLLADIGRVLIGAAFVVSGVRIFMALSIVSGLLAVKRVPYPSFVAAAGAAFEVLAGTIVIVGLWFQALVLLLAAFVVAATVMVHDFWNQEGPERATDINAVISNVIIVGALIVIAGLVGVG